MRNKQLSSEHLLYNYDFIFINVSIISQKVTEII